MSHWINQFTLTYASSIVFGITVIVLSILINPVRTFFPGWIRRFTETSLPVPNQAVISPKKQKRKKDDWDNAIAFLKNEPTALSQDSADQATPGEKVIAHFGRFIRTYQIILSGMVILDFAGTLYQLRWLQIASQIVFVLLLLWMLLAVGFSILSMPNHFKQVGVKVKNVEGEIRPALNASRLGAAFSFGELGELLKKVSERDLPRLQIELSNAGLLFDFDDLRLAHLLATAPGEKLLTLGRGIAPVNQQPDGLPPEKQEEAARNLVAKLRLKPVRWEEAE
jgi:hypothetical protein